jgi:hypothetical protein
MMLHAYEIWTTSMNVLYVCAVFIYVFLLIYMCLMCENIIQIQIQIKLQKLFFNAKNVTEGGK